jgi:hypothetical protein
MPLQITAIPRHFHDIDFNKAYVNRYVYLSCSSQGGIQGICQDIGFGSNFEMRLSREHKGANGTILYAINTDFHVTLELPAILNGNDKLQSKFWYRLVQLL